MSQNMTANAIYELPFGKGKALLNQGGIIGCDLGRLEVRTDAAFAPARS